MKRDSEQKIAKIQQLADKNDFLREQLEKNETICQNADSIQTQKV